MKKISVFPESNFDSNKPNSLAELYNSFIKETHRDAVEEGLSGSELTEHMRKAREWALKRIKVNALGEAYFSNEEESDTGNSEKIY